MVEILNQPMQVSLTTKRKELMWRVMDGHTDLAGVMHILHGYKYCDNFLIWLIYNGYTGKNLKELVVKQFRSSVPSLVDYIVNATNQYDARKIT